MSLPRIPMRTAEDIKDICDLLTDIRKLDGMTLGMAHALLIVASEPAGILKMDLQERLGISGGAPSPA